MPPVLFTNLGMLAGFVALSIPVVIHLLLRRKKKKARFSTLQFFVRQDEQASQRRKLRNWLLLALRLSIFALLVLAFARPYLSVLGPAEGREAKRQWVILLDRSLSMQAIDREGSKWSRAQAAAQRLLEEMKPDDRAALIGCGFRADVLSEWAPPAVVSKAIAGLQPTSGASTLADGLQEAVRLLTFADPRAAKGIAVVSDLQQAGCQNVNRQLLPSGTELKLIAVGDLGTPNLAIADIQLQSAATILPHVAVVSFSDEDQTGLRLDLTVDGQTVPSGNLGLPVGAATNLELALPSLKPGWHDLAFRLHVRDGLALDDARYQTVFVPEPVRVLLVETQPSPRAFEEETFFLTAALDPGHGSSNAVMSRFACETVSLDELQRKLVGAKTAKPCDLVILPGLKQVPAGLGANLLNYVQAGGGLLLFTGEGSSAIRYNAEFRSLLPAQLGTLQTPVVAETAWRLGFWDTNAPPFAPFLEANSGDLALPRFTKRFSMEHADSGRVVARFHDQVPLLLATKVGEGRVVLVNSSADTSWNDWPKHKSFVPWLHGLGHYLAGTESQVQAGIRSQWITGTSGDLQLGESAARAIFHLVAPNGQKTSLTADEQGTLRDVTLLDPGVYSLRQASGQEVRRLVANVPAVESDLKAVASSDLQQQVAYDVTPKQASLAAGLFGAGSNQREFWRVLLLAVLGLLLVEMLVANRTLA